MAGGPITTVLPSTTAARADVARHRAWRRPSTASSGSGCGSTTPSSTSCAGRCPYGRQRAGPVHGAAPHRVPRPAGPGGHEEGVPPDRVHRGPPARQPVLRVEHGRRCSSSTAGASSATTSGSSTPTTRASTRVAHEFGLHDEYYLAELAFADELVGRLLDALPAHATLVVTADHGQVHVGDSWLPLHPLREHVPVLRGGGPVPLPLRRAGRGGRAARGRARTSSATRPGSSPGTSCSTRAGSARAR